ncbi:MAG: porin family protein [Proteobacteria bacterium]|nr:porin family protein [Pseudomonadota bacterium]MBS0573664.1 porin family protein [Pseudomonadota bacterium]
MTTSRIFIRSAAVAALMGGLSLPALAGGLGAPVTEPPVAAPAPVAAPLANGDWTGPWAGLALGGDRTKSGGVSHSGGAYGIRGGYDYDFGQFVLGGALSWDKLNGGSGSTTRLKDVTRLTVRGGADLGQALVYAKVGAARASADIGGASFHDTGWTAGIGADYKLTDQWTIGGEIDHDHFNKFGSTGVKANDTTAQVTLGFRF